MIACENLCVCLCVRACVSVFVCGCMHMFACVCVRMRAGTVARDVPCARACSSYAFPSSRRENVSLGRLHDTPAFEWLDAYEARSSAFYMSLHASSEGRAPTVLAPVEISPDAPTVLSDGASLEVTLF